MPDQLLTNHPLADVFPLPTEAEMQRLTESIAKLGQHEPIVLLEGLILDGRSRYQACLIAKVTPKTRNFDPKKDGPSPVDFVIMKNLERRHLTAGQRAMVATTILPHYEVEAANRKKAAQFVEGGAVPNNYSEPVATGEAAEKAGAAVNVSGASVRRAAKLKEENPAAAAEVAAGTKTLNAAIAETPPEPQGPPPDHDAEEELKSLRFEHKVTLTERHGAEFWKAVRDGIVLKTKGEIKAFMALDEKGQKEILELMKRHWTVSRAVKFVHRLVDRKDLISDLFLRTISAGTKSKTFVVDGWRIRVDRENGASEEK